MAFDFGKDVGMLLLEEPKPKLINYNTKPFLRESGSGILTILYQFVLPRTTVHSDPFQKQRQSEGLDMR